MNIVIILLIFSVMLAPIAMVATKVGEKIEQWLENNFPNVEE